MQRRAWMGSIILIFAIAQGATPQDTPPCENADQYSPVSPGVLDLPPLLVNRVFGRAIIHAGEVVIAGARVAPACLSLFTDDDTHRYVASVPLDSRGRFRFRSVPPGRYRLVERSPGLCTGNSRVEVTTSHVKEGRKGILVVFNVQAVDTCSGAMYDTKTEDENQ